MWNLDRLDGLARRKRSDDNPKTLEDWLQLSDDYEERSSTPGKKRVIKYIGIKIRNVKDLAIFYRMFRTV